MQVTSLARAVCFLLAAAALVASTLERRNRSLLPIAGLIQDRFRWQPGVGRCSLLALAAGVGVVAMPLAALVSMGWARWEVTGSFTASQLGIAFATFGVIAGWAALEELIFRGALLPQVARRSNLMVAVLVSAVVFGLAHLGRSPNLLTLSTLVLDGIGFAVAFVAARSLWPATLWHAAKNLCVWLLAGEGTLQFVPGPLRVTYLGPPLWVGGPHQAGMVDLLVTSILVGAAVVLGWRQLGGASHWAREV